MKQTAATVSLSLAAAALLGLGVFKYKHAPAGLRDAGAPYSQTAYPWFKSARKSNCLEFAKPGTAILFVAGQSNAGNYVETPGKNQHPNQIGSYFGGKCVEARDPLMGADGDRGSPWIRLGNKLIRTGAYKRVLIVPVAMGGAGMDRWTLGSDLHTTMESMLVDLAAINLQPTHFLWAHGEADRVSQSPYKLDGPRYLEALQSIVGTVQRHSKAKIYVAITTRCSDTPISIKAVRWAQQQITLSPGVHRGPDLDAMWQPGDRFDNCHFSTAGADKLTAAWMAALHPSPQ